MKKILFSLTVLSFACQTQAAFLAKANLGVAVARQIRFASNMTNKEMHLALRNSETKIKKAQVRAQIFTKKATAAEKLTEQYKTNEWSFRKSTPPVAPWHVARFVAGTAVIAGIIDRLIS